MDLTITTIRELFPIIFPKHLRIPAKELRKRLRNDYYLIHTLEDMQGFALICNYGTIYHLDYLGVNPNVQGKGIGKQLLLLLTKTYKKISLECEESLVPYYTKFGFKDTKLDYRWNNHKLHFMVLNMSSIEIFSQLTFLQKIVKNNIAIIRKIFFSKNYELIYLWFDKHYTWND